MGGRKRCTGYVQIHLKVRQSRKWKPNVITERGESEELLWLKTYGNKDVSVGPRHFVRSSFVSGADGYDDKDRSKAVAEG